MAKTTTEIHRWLNSFDMLYRPAIRRDNRLNKKDELKAQDKMDKERLEAALNAKMKQKELVSTIEKKPILD